MNFRIARGAARVRLIRCRVARTESNKLDFHNISDFNEAFNQLSINYFRHEFVERRV